jgi:multiple sugar transport system ATP-binding protein
VAGFIGSPAMNFFPAELRDNQCIELPMGEFRLPGEKYRRLPPGRSTFVAGIRPEHLQDAVSSPDPSGDQLRFPVRVDLVEWLGAELFVHFDAEGVTRASLSALPEDLELDIASSGKLRLVARIDTASQARAGEQLELSLDVRRLHLFDPESGASVF